MFVLDGQATSGFYLNSVENDWKHFGAPQTLGKKILFFFSYVNVETVSC